MGTGYGYRLRLMILVPVIWVPVIRQCCRGTVSGSGYGDRSRVYRLPVAGNGCGPFRASLTDTGYGYMLFRSHVSGTGYGYR